MWREIFQTCETYRQDARKSYIKLRILPEGVTCLDAKVIDLRPAMCCTMHSVCLILSTLWFKQFCNSIGGMPMEYIKLLPLILVF